MMAVHQRNKILSSTAVNSEVNILHLITGGLIALLLQRDQLEVKKISAAMMPSTDIF